MTDHENHIIEKLSQAKPKAEVDPGFERQLFARLEREIDSLNQTQTSTINFNFMNFKRLAWVAGPLVIAALVVAVWPQNQATLVLPGSQSITKVNARAFGSLSEVTTASSRNQSGGGSSNLASAPVAETDAKIAPDAVVNPVPGMGGGGTDLIYAPINYEFVYTGEEFTVIEPELEVYERQKGFGSQANLSAFLDRFDVGMFNINKFAGASVDYFRASENREFGYALNLDLKEGYVSIDQVWERWPNPWANCTTEECYQQNRMTPEQVPSDEEAINIANSFLDEYGINRAAYGEPYVQNFWRLEYERATDKSAVYVPDYVSVVYPQRINGLEIYDEGGNKNGLYVGIQARTKRVSNVSQLTDQRFNASAYPTEQDSTRLTEIAERGGFRNYLPFAQEPNAETRQVELGSPIRGYARVWQQEGNTGRELHVPSLIFPITNSPQGYYGQNVVVPLIKEILDSQPDFGGIVRPLPVDLPVRAE